jgi:putative glycosyltransferase
MKLSVVTTLYRSAAYVGEFYARMTRTAAALTDDYELVFVNDGSPDDSLEHVIALYERDAHVRIVDLSRNFGHHRAMMTGLAHATGEMIFLVDVDLEEHPEWLLDFHDIMTRTGADVVYGVQARRTGKFFERLMARLYYKAFNALLEHPIPENVVTARLMTRRYVNSLVQHREREMTLAPLWVITGYVQMPVEVMKEKRSGTSYSFRRRISVFVNNVTSFSNRPLVYIFYLGTGIMLISGLYGIWLIWETTRGRVGVPGWPTLIVSIWFLGGVTIFCLGVIGVYMSKVFIEAKDRPYTIVRAEYDHDRTIQGL